MENSKINTIIVGGGPVGLWTAVQAKIRNKDANIVIFEKHQEYQRKHLLKISKSSLKGAPKHPKLDPIIKEFTSYQMIPTSLIEGKLKKLAQELGIEIRHETIEEPQTLRERFPNAKVIIGADGSHSVVRAKVFDDAMRYRKNIQFIAEVKYRVKGDTRKFHQIKESYPTSKAIERVAIEHIGKKRDGETPVTLRFFISKTMYKEMQHATFKNPATLEDSEKQIHETLRKNIELWLKAKEVVVGEQRIQGSEKITATQLAIYSSKHFVKHDRKNKVTYCLVGDAAFGVPYFRSLNNGLLSGTRLAEVVANQIKPDANEQMDKTSYRTDAAHGRVAKAFNRYAAYAKRLAFFETLIARIKNLFIRFLNWFVRFSNRNPIQTNKWSEQDIIAFGGTPRPNKISKISLKTQEV